MTKAIMTSSLDKDPTFTVIPALEIPDKLVVDYWQLLIDHDLIRYRLCDCVEPNIQTVMQMLYSTLGQTMFMVFDDSRSELRAEFALTNFTGKAAMVHFSMHPDNTPQQSLRYARVVTDQILNVWSERDDPDAPYLYSLYGLTPVTNRAACAFVKRVGFKQIGTLPKGQRQNGGEFVDAMITIKERRHGR